LLKLRKESERRRQRKEAVANVELRCKWMSDVEKRKIKNPTSFSDLSY